MRKHKILILVATVIIIATSSLMSINWVLKVIYPTDYNEIVYKYAYEYDLDPYLVFSIIKAESKFKEEATSKKDAKGLMQIAPITGRWAADVLKIENYNEDMLYVPETNIRMGCWYLSTLKKEFDGNLRNIIAAYNAGSGNVKKWLSDNTYSQNGELVQIPFEETRKYTVKVLTGYKVYKIIYEKNT